MCWRDLRSLPGTCNVTDNRLRSWFIYTGQPVRPLRHRCFRFLQKDCLDRAKTQNNNNNKREIVYLLHHWYSEVPKGVAQASCSPSLTKQQSEAIASKSDIDSKGKSFQLSKPNASGSRIRASCEPAIPTGAVPLTSAITAPSAALLLMCVCLQGVWNKHVLALYLSLLQRQSVKSLALAGLHGFCVFPDIFWFFICIFRLIEKNQQHKWEKCLFLYTQVQWKCLLFVAVANIVFHWSFVLIDLFCVRGSESMMLPLINTHWPIMMLQCGTGCLSGYISSHLLARFFFSMAL